MSVRRSLLLLTILMIALPIAVFARGSSQREQQDTTPDIAQIETYIVGRGDVEQIVSAIGAISPDQTVSLSFLVPGRVAELYVQPGDYLFAGESLVRLDNATQVIARDQALLALDKAQVQYDAAIAPVSPEDTAIAQSNVDAAWGTYLSATNAVTDDDIRAAELAYEQALNNYNDLKAARDQAIGGYGSANYNNLDAQTGAASFNAEIARLQLETLRTGTAPSANAAYARVILAQKQYDQTLAGPTSFQIDSAALSLRASESQLRRSETTLNRTTLLAPFDGVVTAITTEVGGFAAPGVQVIEMTDLSPLRLTVQVDEIDIRLVQPGMTARVELDALQGVSIPALVERVGLLGINQNGIVNYDVALTLDATDARVRVGMTAEANMIVAQRTDTLVIPNIYIRLDRRVDQAFVNLLQADGSITEVEIMLGLQGLETSEVISGLRAGDVIAIDPNGAGFSLFGN
ncbi:MAG: efflux RND transporter periplasmic adaptor subunit [Armatimonadetes bacterium]|nr:efflux RND transporter periplasmic adaptor subunit [Anaerolineae bacterium]